MTELDERLVEGQQVIAQLTSLTEQQITRTQSGDMEDFGEAEQQRQQLINQLFTLMPHAQMKPLYQAIKAFENLNQQLMEIADSSFKESQQDLLQLKRSQKAKQAYKQKF